MWSLVNAFKANSHTLWCVYVWIRGLCLLCTESRCLFENGGNGWIFSVLLVFPTSWTKKRCLTGQDGLFVVSVCLPVYTQSWFLGPVCIWYRETWPMIRALFLPPPHLEHLGELVFYWSGGCCYFLCRQASHRRLQMRPEGERGGRQVI